MESGDAEPLKPDLRAIKDRPAQSILLKLPSEFLGAHRHPACDVHPDAAVQSDSRAVDYGSGMRIARCVPFHWAIIALNLVRESAAHHHEPFKQRRDFRINAEEKADIRQRSDRKKNNLAGMRSNRVP